MSTTSFAPSTGNAATDSLLFGTRWSNGGDVILSYSFPGEDSLWDESVYDVPGEPSAGFLPLATGEEQQAVRDALLSWATVANVSFVEVTDAGTASGALRFAYTAWDMGGSQLAYAYAPNDGANGGDIWLNAALKDGVFSGFGPDTLSSYVLLHEVGHALGLKHPSGASEFSTALLDPAQDSVFNSVMSYYACPGIALTRTNMDRLPSTPMSLDIDALQALYGVNSTSYAGDDHYVFAGDGTYLETIYDTGGNDTIELVGSGGGQIDLRPGEWSQLGAPVQINGGAILIADTVRIYHGTFIENAIGGDGPDSLIGNERPNSLQGGVGNDTLIGGAGYDLLDGGVGTDTADYACADAAITAEIWRGTASNDGQGGSDALVRIENLIGGAFNDLLGGSEGANALNGSDGNDRIYAGGGADVLTGGAGNDFLDGGTGADTASYASASAAVVAEIWRGTASNDGQNGADVLVGVENLIGSAFNDLLAGNESANSLNGTSGNDRIYAGGGADVLTGGAGDDALDGGADTDTADYTSATGAVTVEIWKGTAAADGQGGADTLAGVENATGGAFNDLLVGNEGANVLNGAAGIDVLLGAGGNDTLLGGAGNDLLQGGAGNDALDGGADTDTANYASATGAVTVELWKNTAAADGQGGADTLAGIENATGGAFNDLLVGNEGANVLNGAAGNDVLLGGGGVDTLLGGAGNDTLSGGNGNDTLTGGANQDLFLFANALGAGNIDTITDFSVVDDTIQLENAIFTSLASTGALAVGLLRSGAGVTTAADANDYLIYNTTSGALYYDADGSGASFASQQVATLLGAPALTAVDFYSI